MRIVYDPAFNDRLKRVNIRVQKAVKQRILLFSKNHNDPLLHNHPLKRKYEGMRSINITANWRAIY